MCRVLIAVSGTGGHLFPGLAIAEAFRRSDLAAEVTFVGTARGLEATVVPRAGFELERIEIAGLKRVGWRQAVVTLLWRVPTSLLQSWRLLRRRRPDIVIGIGGYTSGPVVLMAALMGIPTLILEPNAHPGFTNRVLAPLVRAAAVAFPEAAAVFGAKARVTGNPVRPEFFTTPDQARERRARTRERHLLIFGGSQGSRALNERMIEALPKLWAALHERGSALEVTATHQTGEQDAAWVRAAYERAGLQERVTVVPFIERMAEEMARADLVICRAGATTLAELAAAGKPAILIPLPTSADDHQRKNAQAVERAGAARCVPQDEATPDRLAELIRTLLEDAAQLEAMAECSRRRARPEAAQAIVALAREVMGHPARSRDGVGTPACSCSIATGAEGSGGDAPAAVSPAEKRGC
jgi:UDP-N-acetylglucosamine--N-acetylmuramyl-(pentapeptide) pyrophosphoryl-undecaprenol N-acetylglucosamine transferase